MYNFIYKFISFILFLGLLIFVIYILVFIYMDTVKQAKEFNKIYEIQKTECIQYCDSKFGDIPSKCFRGNGVYVGTYYGWCNI